MLGCARTSEFDRSYPRSKGNTTSRAAIDTPVVCRSTSRARLSTITESSVNGVPGFGFVHPMVNQLLSNRLSRRSLTKFGRWVDDNCIRTLIRSSTRSSVCQDFRIKRSTTCLALKVLTLRLQGDDRDEVQSEPGSHRMNFVVAVVATSRALELAFADSAFAISPAKNDHLPPER